MGEISEMFQLRQDSGEQTVLRVPWSNSTCTAHALHLHWTCWHWGLDFQICLTLGLVHDTHHTQKMLIISWIDHNWSMCQSVSMSCKENDMKHMKQPSNYRTSSDFLTSIVLPRDPRAIGIASPARCNSTALSHRRRRRFSTCLPRRWRLGNAKAGLAWPRRCDVLNWYDHFTYYIYIYILYTYYIHIIHSLWLLIKANTVYNTHHIESPVS